MTPACRPWSPLERRRGKPLLPKAPPERLQSAAEGGGPYTRNGPAAGRGGSGRRRGTSPQRPPEGASAGSLARRPRRESCRARSLREVDGKGARHMNLVFSSSSLRQSSVQLFEPCSGLAVFLPLPDSSHDPACYRYRVLPQSLGQVFDPQAIPLDAECCQELARSDHLAHLASARQLHGVDSEDLCPTLQVLVDPELRSFPQAPLLGLRPGRLPTVVRILCLRPRRPTKPPPWKMSRTLPYPLALPSASYRPSVRRPGSTPTRPKQPKHLVDIDDGLSSPSQKLVVTTPPILRRILDNPGNHRVQVNVGQYLVQVPLIPHKLRPIPPLPQRPEYPALGVQPPRRSLLKTLDRPVQGDRACSNRKVVVVRHEHPGEDSYAVANRDLAQQLNKPLCSLIGFENPLPAGKPVVHVVNRTIEENPPRSRHPESPLQHHNTRFMCRAPFLHLGDVWAIMQI